ncbi:MAG: hypothetical protein JSW68_12285 [Burkholderiales bacterium]|nr:MAG: hypothetical protein JSW68_12285 [Burkholderiales bacterium]
MSWGTLFTDAWNAAGAEARQAARNVMATPSADGAQAVTAKAGGWAARLIAAERDAQRFDPSQAAADPVQARPQPARTGLGTAVDALVSRSPALANAVLRLQQRGWRLKLGPAGKGSFATARTRTITIDGAEASKPEAVVRALAHAAGCALHPAALDTGSKQAFVRAQLTELGAALYANLKVQRQIVTSGGPNIGLVGAPANYRNHLELFERLRTEGDAEKARGAFAAVVGRMESAPASGQAYEQHFAQWFDARLAKGPK